MYNTSFMITYNIRMYSFLGNMRDIYMVRHSIDSQRHTVSELANNIA